MNYDKYVSSKSGDKAVYSNNGEVYKAIDFKIQKILDISINAIKKESKEESRFEEIRINTFLNRPVANKTLKDLLENYYYGLFFDGIVYFLTFENGFYVARENEVVFEGKTLKINNKIPIDFFIIGNKNQATNSYEPQFYQIEGTLREKFYSQMLNVHLLEKGTVISHVLTDKTGSITDEDASSLRQRLSSLFGLKKQVKYGEYSTDEESGTLILKGDWESKFEKANLADLNNTNNVNKQRDYIYNFLGVPPQLMGSSESSTFSNYKEAMSNFLLNSVIPEAKIFINLINQHFLQESNYLVELDIDNIPELIEMKTSKFNILSQLRDDGVITDDQLLDESGFSNLKGGD